MADFTQPSVALTAMVTHKDVASDGTVQLGVCINKADGTLCKTKTLTVQASGRVVDETGAEVYAAGAEATATTVKNTAATFGTNCTALIDAAAAAGKFNL